MEVFSSSCRRDYSTSSLGGSPSNRAWRIREGVEIFFWFGKARGRFDDQAQE
jgi:hypothetical protein